MIRGVFLYNHGAAYIAEILKALRSLNINIRNIEANSDIVSNLVPRALQRGAESWLIFFLPDKEGKLLILPFPDENLLQRARNFRGYLEDLIPCVMECLKYEKLDIPPGFIERFQYIRPDSSLDSLLTEPFDVGRSRSDVQIQSTLLRGTESIQQQRSKVLSKVLRSRDPVRIDGILNELDEVFDTENGKIFEYLQTTQFFEEVVPPIVTDFKDIIDDETKRFLITSETVRKFADDYSPGNFDYSAPGCGLWKAVEREINLSLVLYVREAFDIVDINNPWRGIMDPGRKIQIQTGNTDSVDLNKRERKNKNTLSALMLGNITYMLKWGNINKIREELEYLGLSEDMLLYFLGSDNRTRRVLPLKKDTLPWHLQKLGRLRNSHAHTSAMSHEQFNKLRDLVLPSSSNPGTCLVKLLDLKRKVYEKSGRYCHRKNRPLSKPRV